MTTGGVSVSLRYDIATEPCEVERLSRAWDALLDRSVCNRAFSSAEWFAGACRTNAALSPYVLMALRDGELVALLPLALNTTERALQFPAWFSDYNDVVAAQGDEEVVGGLLRFAMSGGPAYNRVMLAHLRDDSNCAKAMRRIRNGCAPDRFGRRERAFYIPLGSGLEGYLHTRSSQFRRGLRRTLRVSRDHDVSARELNTADFPPSRLPELFLDLHLKRFPGRTQFRFPHLQTFVLDVFPTLYAQGKLRPFALLEKDRIIGIDICMAGARSLCSWNGGFLPEAERWSPGVLLIHAEIREVAATGLAEYDFLRGSEDYKLRWTSHSRAVNDLQLDL